MNLHQNEINILNIVFHRYLYFIQVNKNNISDKFEKCSAPHLEKLCKEALDNMHAYPFDKLCRWLGFVQGVLSANGIIDVDQERDVTRPLFHSLHSDKIPSFG